MRGSLYLVLMCAIFSSCASLRPSRQMSYAEAAFQAATLAGAETSHPNLYQLARDALLQARASYRLKNFKQARILAVKARRAAEDAEIKALQAATNPSGAATPETR